MMDGSDICASPIHPFRSNKQRDGVTNSRFFTRTARPVKYYLIDFGHAKVYDSNISLEATLDAPGWGAGDSTIPEFTKDADCNPFSVDVYCMGNLIRQEFTEVIVLLSSSLRFAQPLIRVINTFLEDVVLAL